MTDWVDRLETTGMVALLWPNLACPSVIYCPDVRTRTLIDLGYYAATGIKNVQIRTRATEKWYKLAVHGHCIVEIGSSTLHEPYATFVGCVELAHNLGSVEIPDEFTVMQAKLIASQGLVITCP